MLPTTDYARFYARLIGIALEGRGEEGRREKRREGRGEEGRRGDGKGRVGEKGRGGDRR